MALYKVCDRSRNFLRWEKKHEQSVSQAAFRRETKDKQYSTSLL